MVAATSGETSADEASPDEASMGEAPAVDVTRLRVALARLSRRLRLDELAC